MNENITSYCIKYLESEENPQFAVFLKGVWGCGKTYFIKNLISKYDSATDTLLHNQIIYISLFGVNSSTEIDQKIFHAVHPILSSKGMQIAGAVFRTALKIGINFDLNGDKINDGTISLKGIDRIKNTIDLSTINTRVIIVDDIERSGLSPSEIFGYFSDFIITGTVRIIFVGNEEKIENENSQKKNEYLAIKEKTIGLEFLINPDVNEAVSFFINEMMIDKNYAREVQDICLDVIDILNCKNLRTIRQCIYNLSFLVNAIDNDVLDKHKRIIVKIFFALYIQKSGGVITEDDPIGEIILAFEKYRIDYADYKIKKNENAKNNFMFSYYSQYVPLSNCWKEIIFHGNYSKNFIIDNYNSEKSKNIQVSLKTLYNILNTWRSMSAKDFKKNVNLLHTEVNNGVYLHPGELLHYYNIMVIFSKYGLIPKKEDEIKEDLYKILGRIKSKLIALQDFDAIDVGYAGWSYSDDIQSLPEVKRRIQKISETNLEISVKKELNKRIIDIPKDVKLFCKDIMNTGNNKYYHIPILSLINIKLFFQMFQSLSTDDQMLIISAFEERYGKRYSNGTVDKQHLPDLENLIQLHNLYEKRLHNVVYNPTAYFKKHICGSLLELITYLKKST